VAVAPTGEAGVEGAAGNSVQVRGKIIDTAAAKRAEHARIAASFKATGWVPQGNWKSFKP